MSLRKYIFPLSLILLSEGFAATAYINQIGYRTSDIKELTLFEGSGNVDFVNEKGEVAYTATPMEASIWSPSGQSVQRVDFSELQTPGTYTIKVNGQEIRGDLKITDNTYEDVMKASIKFFYYQRASIALDEQYAGQWSRLGGHFDTQVHLHASTGEDGMISSPKGWYDAGDYGKYIVNSGISTYTLLSLYEHFPDYFDKVKWNIPSDGDLPDLLAEIKYNLDWMLTMQSKDGGVYHKLTTLNFSGEVMPTADKAARYAIGKSTAAAFDFAAVLAAASRIYKKFDASYADKCLQAAKKAYDWGVSNPNAKFSNPSDVGTGEYGDGYVVDEKQFAAAELFITTGESTYKLSGTSKKIPSWADVDGLANYEKATHLTEYGDYGSAAKTALLEVADNLANRINTGFGVVISSGDFVWGSSGVAANQGVWLLHAYYVTGDEKYYKAALMALDYLLGKNPLDMSFVTGSGTKSPMHPHHRPSQADGITAPVPGMVAGGPHSGLNDVKSCPNYSTGFPATTYLDNDCSYATNEVAINWNAPFAYLAGALEALHHGFAPSFADKSIVRGNEGTESIRNFGWNSSSMNKTSASKLRFKDQMLYVERNGVKYNLKGHKIK